MKIIVRMMMMMMMVMIMTMAKVLSLCSTHIDSISEGAHGGMQGYY